MIEDNADHVHWVLLENLVVEVLVNELELLHVMLIF